MACHGKRGEGMRERYERDAPPSRRGRSLCEFRRNVNKTWHIPTLKSNKGTVRVSLVIRPRITKMVQQIAISRVHICLFYADDL